jgi:hypothetical protein
LKSGARARSAQIRCRPNGIMAFVPVLANMVRDESTSHKNFFWVRLPWLVLSSKFGQITFQKRYGPSDNLLGYFCVI